LVDEAEPEVIGKLSNCEVDIKRVSEGGFGLEGGQEGFREGANDRLFIVGHYFFEELIDEFNFEVGEVEAGVVVAVELIAHIQN